MKNKRKLIKFFDGVVGVAILSSVFVLLSATGVYAEGSAVDNVTVTVPVACSITSIIGSAHTATVDVGTYAENIGETTFKVLCNDANGFAVYAIGYSGETYGNTTMVPSNLPATNGIVTGTATSGGTSNWAMKLTAVSGDYQPTLGTGFNAYHEVPSDYTLVASLAASTDATVGSQFKSTYAAFVAQAQPADTYTGKVKYTVIHPANETAPDYLEQMQNLSSSSCTSTPTQVRDIRDGHAYTIQRLRDGKCWMMENLDLGRTDLAADLTSENTNLTTTVTASTFNGWKKTSGTQTLTAGEFIPVDGTDTTSNTAYGTLYNYCAASAGTICSSSNSSDASYDICPAGWRLPTGALTGDLQNLYEHYNSVALMLAPITENGVAFANAGSFTSTPTGQGSTGNYWTSTYYGNTNMERLWIMPPSTFSLATHNSRYFGYSIRCVLKERSMQSVSSWGSSVTAGQEVTAIDVRDGKAYTVARLADGNLWMTQNLDHNIDSTKTYTSADTDIPANWTPSTSTYTTDTTTWNKTKTAPESYDPGNRYYNGTLYDGSYTDTDYYSTTGDSHYHFGNYYNWTAAIAMNDSSSYSTYGTLANQSICPAGWTLPRAGRGEDTFYALVSAYDTWNSSTQTLENNTLLWDNPTNFTLIGRWMGSFRGLGKNGEYLSSVVNDVYAALEFYITYNGLVRPAADSNSAYYREDGYPIRCIARPVTNTIVFSE